MSRWLNWWNGLRPQWHVARGDLAGGVTAALVLLAVEGSYGLVAFGSLGPYYAQQGFLLGVFAAAIGTLASLLGGGRGPMLSGTGAALALLVPTLMGALMLDPSFRTPDGSPYVPLLLAFLGLGLLLAGVIQVAAAAFNLGSLVHYVPFPVHAGYINGSAVLMIIAMLPHIFGLPSGASAFASWRDFQPLAPLVALAAVLIALRAPAWTRRVPPYVTALVAATGLHHLLALTPLAGQLGPLFHAPMFEWPSFDAMGPLVDHFDRGLVASQFWPLLQFAAAVAMMSSLQTALAGSTIDELTRKRRNSERELLAQGISNMAVGMVGALPTAASTTRSKLNLDAGATTRLSRLFFGVALLLALAPGLRFMSHVPMAAIAGVFVAAAFSLFDDWTRRATGVVWRQTLKWRLPRALGQNFAIMLLVAGVTVFVSLPLAIGLGTLIAMLMFIRGNIRHPIRQVVHVSQRTSRKVRAAAEAGLLRKHGDRIAMIELDGALFFGTAEAADEEIERLERASDQIVLDFERVSEVDASGARVLVHAAIEVNRAGKHMLFAGLIAGDSRLRMIREMDVHGQLDDAQFFADADRALEHAEDRLIAGLQHSAQDGGPLSLGETLLGAGLDVDEVDLLASMMVERRIPKGQAVFRNGDPGEAMYVSLQGQIGIWLAAARDGTAGLRDRRMVSYAPGVVFGEMGLLARQARSADAIAESDALVLELGRADYDRLVADHPALLSKLLINMGLLLAARVRSLTDELQSAQSSR